MIEFVGHEMKVLIEGMGSVRGKLVADRSNMILMKGEDGAITRIMKNKISAFTPVGDEPFKFIPFHFLFCENSKDGCKGVKCIHEGQGFTRGDIENFVSQCQFRNENCKMGTKGELRTVSSDILSETLTGTVYGDYPEKELKSGRD